MLVGNNRAKEPIRGASLVSDIKKVLKRDDLPVAVRKILENHGDIVIKSITLGRTPIEKIFSGALSIFTMGEFDKQKKLKNYDELFHLYMKITLENNKVYALEKNLSITLSNYKNRKNEQQQIVSNVPSGMTLNSILANTKSKMGSRMYMYDAVKNNCQDFLVNLFKGNNIGNLNDISFIKQDTETLFKTLPILKNVAKFATDVGSAFEDVFTGGDLNSKEVKNLLKSSYDTTLIQNGFVLDTEISKGYNNVFYNSDTGEVAMTVAGTSDLKDWKNNLIYGVYGRKGYKETARFKTAKDIHDKAVAKYGNKNITILGHSQGAISAELLGGDDKEIITYNKATAPFVKQKINKNQTNLRVNRDIVSNLNRDLDNTTKTINTKFINPIKTHSINRLPKNWNYKL